MRQEIPEKYFWSPSELLDLWEKWGRLFMVILSYCWLSADHPDPDMFQLKKLVRILKPLKQHWRRHSGIPDVAVVIDFCSLWQKHPDQDRRSPEQKTQFNDGLVGFNLLYVHQKVTCLVLKDVPAHELRTYDDRGWTLCEQCLVGAKPGMLNQYHFYDPPQSIT